MDLRRSDRRTAMKVLVSKNFKFVDLIWSQYIDLIKTDLRFNDTSNMGLWCHYNIHVYNRPICDEDETEHTDDELDMFEEGAMIPNISDDESDSDTGTYDDD